MATSFAGTGARLFQTSADGMTWLRTWQQVAADDEPIRMFDLRAGELVTNENAGTNVVFYFTTDGEFGGVEVVDSATSTYLNHIAGDDLRAVPPWQGQPLDAM